MRAEVYWNVHKKLFSVRALEGPDKGRVVAHLGYIQLKPAKFVVQEAGRAKVIATGRKNVHAFIRGEWLEELIAFDKIDLIATPIVRYNPYMANHFTTDNSYRLSRRIDQAWAVECSIVDGKPQIRAIL